jgi:hypothetical protein
MPELGQLEFPLLKYYISPVMVKKLMEGLKKYKKYPTGRQSAESSVKELLLFIHIDYERDKNILMLSDYFNQEARMKATFLNSMSPWDYFQKNKKSILKELGVCPDYEQIYSHLWSNTRMCSSFPVIVAKAIIDMFKPSRVFDPCAGWGDRMLACIAAEIPYVGVDPNGDLRKGYSSMIDIFDLLPEDYTLISKPFEDFIRKPTYTDVFGEEVRVGKFPLIFTSPPFFNMEGYADDDTQSIIKFPTYDKWKTGFLFPMIEGCVNLLEKEGKLVIYVNNIRKYHILSDTREYLDTLPIKYLGQVSWKNSKYPKYLLVYQTL